MSMETVSVFVEMLLTALVAVAVPVLTVFIVQYFKAKQAELKRYIPDDILHQINMVASLVVKAAEQSGLKDEMLKEGGAKKQWAMDTAQAYLKQTLGLSLDLDKLGDTFWDSVMEGMDAAIEARVLEMNNKQRPIQDITYTSKG